MTSYNTIRELRFVHAGDDYTERDQTSSGGGFYRETAKEPGYWIQLADGVVFVTERQLAEARVLAFVERHEPIHAPPVPELLDPFAEFCDAPPPWLSVG